MRQGGRAEGSAILCMLCIQSWLIVVAVSFVRRRIEYRWLLFVFGKYSIDCKLCSYVYVSKEPN